SFYKRFSRADDDEAIEELARELEDRFGPPPAPARAFIRAMTLKPPLRELRAHGIELAGRRLTLHLREDTPLDPQKVMALVSQPGSGYKITPDLRLSRRFDDDDRDSVERALETLEELLQLRKDEEPS